MVSLFVSMGEGGLFGLVSRKKILAQRCSRQSNGMILRWLSCACRAGTSVVKKSWRGKKEKRKKQDKKGVAQTRERAFLECASSSNVLSSLVQNLAQVLRNVRNLGSKGVHTTSNKLPHQEQQELKKKFRVNHSTRTKLTSTNLRVSSTSWASFAFSVPSSFSRSLSTNA
jgi:hypothetical protein